MSTLVTAADGPEPDAPATTKPMAAKRFSRFKPAMPREEAARQGRIAARAWSVFQDREAVMAFLNTHDDDLGGRPLDVAIASEEGLLAIERVLAARSA